MISTKLCFSPVAIKHKQKIRTKDEEPIVSYQVIARKYRPQTFADLTGQEHITRALSHALDHNRLHHAYLFSGVRGTGKTTTARILAKGLNCRAEVTSRPCLQCASCAEIATGSSIDVLEIDAASNTGVDNVRDVIINNIAMAPARDRYKVFIIDEVHMLSTSAFNALLKTLEEPPSHVIFIMATTELHKVPDTILSRCQQFEFRQIPTEKIFLRLREIAGSEGVKVDDSALLEIARAGAGSLRDAQSAFDQVIVFSGDEITEEDVTTSLGLVSSATLGRFVKSIAGRDISTMIALVEEVSSRGYDLRNFARELMAYFRHLLVVKSGIASADVIGVTDTEIGNLKQLAAGFSEEDLVRCFHLLAQTEKEIKDSPHPRFQLEIGLVKLTHATRLRSLDELIDKLEKLESGISNGTSGEISGYSAAKNATSRQSPGRGANEPAEPPDLPDYDLSEPVDITDPEPRPSPGSSAAVAQSTPNAGASRVLSGSNEVEVIRNEVQKRNRGLILTAFEDAQSLEYRDGTLIATFGNDDMFAKRLRDSGRLFHEIGEQLFGQPVKIEVKLSGQAEERVDEAEMQRLRLRDRAMKSPAVRMIVEKTKADILWVREGENPASGSR
jgi:DNA polymerase-3 subunit gamma/tau